MNPYTEIEFKGQKIGLYYGLPALEDISDDIDLLQGKKTISLNLFGITSILFSGYKNNCMLRRMHEEFKYEDFYFFIESNMIEGIIPDEIQNAVNIFAKSKLTSRKAENGEEKKMTV